MRRSRIFLTIAGVTVVIIVSAVLAGPLMSRVEQRSYSVLTAQGPIEIRDYKATIVAETDVIGERKVAVSEGFSLLAAYIFGANRPNTKIAMTAPVQQSSSQSIAMTAPVTQTFSGSSWAVRFTMPQTWTLETLPAPNDARVRLISVPATRILAVRFSGIVSDEKIKAQTEHLRSFAKQLRLTIADDPVLAFYDPPWTLPFMRRNEVMFEVK